MESTPLISPTMDLLFFPLGLLFFIAWIIRRRKIRKKKIEVNKLTLKKPYTTSQIFGIIGILIFILPIFLSVGSILQKGLYILVLLLFVLIEFPNTVAIILKTLYFVSTTFCLFSGVYLVCEMMWPKRNVDKIIAIKAEQKIDSKAPKDHHKLPVQKS